MCENTHRNAARSILCESLFYMVVNKTLLLVLKLPSVLEEAMLDLETKVGDTFLHSSL